MKKSFVAPSMLLLVLGCATLFAQQKPFGVVTAVQGTAQLTRAQLQAPLRFRDGLVVRDVVDTQEKSLARILFGGRSTVTVRELSRLVVREEILATGGRRDVHELSSGAVLVNVVRQLMRSGDEVQIRTPNAVAAVRGTLIFAEFDPLLRRTIFACIAATVPDSCRITPVGQPTFTLSGTSKVSIAGAPATGVRAEAVRALSIGEEGKILEQFKVGPAIQHDASAKQIALKQLQQAGNLAKAVLEAVTGSPPTTSRLVQQQARDPAQGTVGSPSDPQTTLTAVAREAPKEELSCQECAAGGTDTARRSVFPLATPTEVSILKGSLFVPGNLFQIPAGKTVTPSKPLLTVSTILTIGGRVLELGGILSTTIADPLFGVDTESTVTTGNDLVLIAGGGSRASLSGPLLGTGTTLNIGSSAELSGDLLDVRDGGELEMNSADPMVIFGGGRHTIGTADATANNTPNRLFRLSGVHTDPVTGLGTDQPVKGNGQEPPPFPSAAHPVGTLLKATGAASIEVRAGSGDQAGGGVFPGNALFFDRALLEASQPILHLIGTDAGGIPVDTTLVTAGDTMDLVQSRAVSLGPVVALDRGLINVNNGALIILRDGSNMDVMGDLLSLASGSKINVVNGPLIRVDGIALTGSDPAPSSLNVSGALVTFGGTGGNQIVVNNNIAPNPDSSRGIPVSGANINIGPNPITNPNFGSVIVNGKTVGADAEFTGSLIQTTNGGRVNIGLQAQ